MIGVKQAWIYLSVFLDALVDEALGTDRVPPEIKQLYPDYQAIDVDDGVRGASHPTPNGALG